MKTHLHRILKTLAPAVMALLAACNRPDAPDCLQHAGDYASEYRSLPPFSSIELNDYIQIELCDSAGYAVSVHAPENLIPEVFTSVEGGKLVVENGNSCNWVRAYNKPITVRICAPAFPDIQNFSTGDLRTVNTLECAVFKLENRHAAGVLTLALAVDSCFILTHTGVCDVIASGVSGHTELFNQGLGTTDARDLHSESALVNNSTINDVYVHATAYLFAYIGFDGNVYYAGNPGMVDQISEGSGAVIPLP